MSNMKDSPGVYIPPPLVYLILFLLSLLIQKFLPLSESFLHTLAAHVIGTIFIISSLFITVPAIRQFIKTKNTLVTIRPANSLQTSGIYAVSRNPMYLSLLLLYSGVAFLLGNWWTILLLPILAVIVTYFIIQREERYLERTFGETYFDYKKKVNRWI